MKNFRIIFFFFIVSFLLIPLQQIASQVDNSSYSNDNFKNNPFQVGFETGTIISFKKNQSFKEIGYLGYLDINLHKKISFLEIELGGFKGINSSEKLSAFISLSYMHRLLKFDKSRIYGLFGAAAGPFPQWISSLRYLYTVNKFLGFTVNVKYPIGSYKNSFVSFGIQIFTN